MSAILLVLQIAVWPSPKVILSSSNIPKVHGARHASSSSGMAPLVSAFHPRKVLKGSPVGGSKSLASAEPSGSGTVVAML